MALIANNIYFRYSKNKPWVLENKSIKVEKGEIVTILAPSGYGKSTLALILAGYLKPNKGEVLLDDKPLANKGVCKVQLVYQHPEKAINPRWKLKKVLEETSSYNHTNLNKFGIEEAWLDRYPRELSGGELQRFSLARALMANPDYLICDEITTMLDVISQAQIWNLILDYSKNNNIGLIIVTHNKNLANKISTRIIDLTGREQEIPHFFKRWDELR